MAMLTARRLLIFAGVALVMVAWMFCDPRHWGIFATTAYIAGIVCAISVPVGAFLAFAFLRTNLVGRQIGNWLLFPLLMLPLVVQVAAWETLLGKLGWFTLRSGELTQPILTGASAAILIHTAAAIPWVVLIVAAGLKQLDRRWEEFALLQSPWPLVTMRLTIPALAPYLLAAAVWVLVTTAGEMTVTNIYMLRTYAEEIYTAVALRESAATLIKLLLPAALAFGGLVALVCGIFLQSGANQHGDFLTNNEVTEVHSWGINRWLASLVVWSLVSLLVVIPVVSLASRIGMEVTTTGTERVRQWSATKVIRVLSQAPQRYGDDAFHTFQIAVAAATLGVLGGLALVWWGRQNSGNFLLGFFTVSLLIPGPLVGYFVIQILNRAEDTTGFLIWCYDRTIIPPVLALLPRVVPVAGLILLGAIRSTPRELLDQARLATSSSCGQLLILLRGCHFPALIAAFGGAFVIACGDISTTILVLPPGVSTLTFRIFGLLHSGCDDQVAAICLLMLLGTFLIGIVASGPFRKTAEILGRKSQYPL